MTRSQARERLILLEAEDRARGEFVARTWRERLFSRPWRPFVRRRWHEPFTPERLHLSLRVYFTERVRRDLESESAVARLFLEAASGVTPKRGA